jgi:regulator of sirC expression with transglutaminase-like and TPR domain
MLRYVEAVLTVDSNRGEERFIRAVLSYQQGRNAEARADAQWLLDQRPEDVDLDRVRQFVELLDRR